MKFSDIAKLVYDYENASYSPSRVSVKFGCDCGCGGDSYTTESWNKEEDAAELAINEVKSFCEKYGFEYDGVE